MVVDLDGILRQASELRDHGLGQRWRLRADPDVTTILAEMDRAVHRLHCGMCQERKLIDRFDPLRRAGERRFSIAFIAGHHAGLLRGLFELADETRAVDRRIRAVIPLVAVALSPFLAAHMWSATTATASSIRTTWRTPFTESAAASFTDFGLPPSTGEMAMAAIVIPSNLVSMPNSARPSTLSGVSSRLAGVPINVKSFSCFSGTLSRAGTGRVAAASANSP